jgi:hypothetical protein
VSDEKRRKGDERSPKERRTNEQHSCKKVVFRRMINEIFTFHSATRRSAGISHAGFEEEKCKQRKAKTVVSQTFPATQS